MDDMDYISYSQFHTYTSCPRSWYLSKVRQAEEKQTWYIPVGSAVHNMIEDVLDNEHVPKPTPQNADAYLYPLIEKQMLIEPDLSKWLAGGPEDAPTVEDKALKLVEQCFEEALQRLSEVDVWEVEYDATGALPGLSVPIKAYVDIVGEHREKGPVILDWKTGSTKPGNFQLETYSALWQTQHPAEPIQWGRYVMLAPGTPNTRYVDLLRVDPLDVGRKYQAVYDQMEQRLYQAKSGFGCRFCFNQDNCLDNSGMTQRAVYYDRSAEDGIPF